MRLINRKHGSFVGGLRQKKMKRVGFVALALFSAVSTVAFNNQTGDGNLATEDASGMAIGSGRIVVAPPDLGNPLPDLEEARITRVELKKPPAIQPPPVARIPLGPLARALFLTPPAPTEVEAPSIAGLDLEERIAPIELVPPPRIQLPPVDGKASVLLEARDLQPGRSAA